MKTKYLLRIWVVTLCLSVPHVVHAEYNARNCFEALRLHLIESEQLSHYGGQKLAYMSGERTMFFEMDSQKVHVMIDGNCRTSETEVSRRRLARQFYKDLVPRASRELKVKLSACAGVDPDLEAQFDKQIVINETPVLESFTGAEREIHMPGFNDEHFACLSTLKREAKKLGMSFNLQSQMIMLKKPRSEVRVFDPKNNRHFDVVDGQCNRVDGRSGTAQTNVNREVSTQLLSAMINRIGEVDDWNRREILIQCQTLDEELLNLVRSSGGSTSEPVIFPGGGGGQDK